MIVPHTTHVGVPPQRKDLTDDGHPAQRAVNQLHDVGITHLLEMETAQAESLLILSNELWPQF